MHHHHFGVFVPQEGTEICAPLAELPLPQPWTNSPNKHGTDILNTDELTVRKYWMIERGEKVDTGLNNAVLINKYRLDIWGNWLTPLMNHQYLVAIWKKKKKGEVVMRTRRQRDSCQWRGGWEQNRNYNLKETFPKSAGGQRTDRGRQVTYFVLCGCRPRKAKVTTNDDFPHWLVVWQDHHAHDTISRRPKGNKNHLPFHQGSCLPLSLNILNGQKSGGSYSLYHR